MKVLVVGNGGREHALVWKLAKSPLIAEIIVAPGSDAMAADKARLEAVASDDLDGLVALATRENIDLVVVGPEAPLVSGLADRLRAKGIRVFGPSSRAAMLEGSKVFAKEFMTRHGILTAPYSVHSNLDSAMFEVRRRSGKCVVKADGLAAGKGVVVCRNTAQAESAVLDVLQKGFFGQASGRIVIEDLLEGEEASCLAISDGERFVTLAAAQDHKAAYDGDKGPNTGGMGAYAPAPLVTKDMMKIINEQVFKRTVAGMAKDGNPFIGVLYAGVMIADNKPFVLEFNVRFGDPECQPLMALMKHDLAPLLIEAADGKLKTQTIEWNEGAALCVVLASEGYPGSYEKGKAITGLDKAASDGAVTLFHAGTKLVNEQYVTTGGRVLGVTALGKNLHQAADSAYNAARKIQWKGIWMRRDIGHRALPKG